MVEGCILREDSRDFYVFLVRSVPYFGKIKAFLKVNKAIFWKMILFMCDKRVKNTEFHLLIRIQIITLSLNTSILYSFV